MKTEYEKFIQEYLELNHMELVPYGEQFNPNAHYIPHHCVFKDSTTTKLRVVFNVSQKTSNGKSLNEQLAMGSCEQPDIFSLFLQFRTFKYAFTADLEKMYRQIWVDPVQTDLLRILWRNTPKEPIRAYRLKTVTYGTANAPYLAIRVLNQLSRDVINKFPMASNIIRNNMYVDDVLSGAFTNDELFQAYRELKLAFQSAGCNLRKWCSNSPELLNIIPIADREIKADESNIKILGISWSAIRDEFTFELDVASDTNPTTKRMLLS